MDAVTLRPLGVLDAEAVSALLASQRAAYVSPFRPFGHDLASVQAELSAAVDDVYLGVWWDEMLMGVVLLRGWDAGHAMPALGICIDEAYAGTGVADAALRMALCTARYRGARTVMLHVDIDNVRARRCFGRHGFVEVSRAGPVLRMEAIIVGVYEAETDLRTLYDPDVATVQRNIRTTYGMAVPDAYARDFIAFVEAGMEATGVRE